MREALERLLSRAIRLDSGCLVLPNHEDHPTVYPSVRISRTKTARANRLVWEAANGPTELHICHTCDYARCFALEHLFAGDASTNMRDMASKGRHDYPSGEAAFNWRGGLSKDRRAYLADWRSRNREKLAEKARGYRAEAREVEE